MSKILIDKAIVAQIVSALNAGVKISPNSVLHDRLRETLEQPTMSDTIRDFVECMSVSVDVSTGEHDVGRRYFGTVTEVMDAPEDKHGVTLLVQDAEPNFEQPQVEQEPVAWCALNADRSGIAYFDGRPIIMTEPIGNEHHPDPLYTKPQPKREPLTLAQIAEVFGWKPGYLPTPEQVHDARAIEAAHNIK